MVIVANGSHPPPDTAQGSQNLVASVLSPFQHRREAKEALHPREDYRCIATFVGPIHH
jgi:hypothetical protein